MLKQKQTTHPIPDGSELAPVRLPEFAGLGLLSGHLRQHQPLQQLQRIYDVSWGDLLTLLAALVLLVVVAAAADGGGVLGGGGGLLQHVNFPCFSFTY